MHVAVLVLELRFGDCRTLRQKRRRLEKIIAKVRRHFNVAMLEVDRHDRPEESILGVAAVGRARREAREVLERIADALGCHPRAELVRHAIRDLC
ncbi:MAG: DUF503 domain-containing protein [Isosphaeraceae bacterium]|nr:DUF503 domain-containing protein [Isosphaeraceae bacterium]